MRRVGLPLDQLPDETLLAGLSGDDAEITVAFVRRFQRKVYGVALSVLGDPRLAEDVAQQAFERAWRHARTYDARKGSVGAWLTAITRNLAIDTARVRRPVPADPDELLVRVQTSFESPERSAVVGESAEELRAALHQLPRHQARAIVLAGIVGLSASQVAETEGVPLGTAKTRIRTAMQRLRTTLVSEDQDDD
ncbi:MAG: sigma-70 family RNA polymerase sigma factor [Actinomycetota bacterium]|nr:sigma-70 family RNA polymerase sigma factor [Actinomycetota bacterium]